ncbi:hypothetical protein XarjCFBP7653_19570 [Xanthomonas arboricola]|nr:hypothetical protein XarjCFBP7653_19570 [Xanthomonas arboricola]
MIDPRSKGCAFAVIGMRAVALQPTADQQRGRLHCGNTLPLHLRYPHDDMPHQVGRVQIHDTRAMPKNTQKKSPGDAEAF